MTTEIDWTLRESTGIREPGIDYTLRESTIKRDISEVDWSGGVNEIPAPVIIPSNAVVRERTAQGKPSVMETPDGERYFTPYSTPYRQGHRTYSGFLKAQAKGANLGPYSGDFKFDTVVHVEGGKAVARYSVSRFQRNKPEVPIDSLRIPIKTYTGKERLLTFNQAEKLSKANVTIQYKLAKRYGIIPADTSISEFAQSKNSLKKSISTSKAEVIPGYSQAVVQEKRQLEKYQQDLMSFEKQNFKTVDNVWVSRNDLKKLKSESPEIYKVLLSKGFNAANKGIERYNKSAVAVKVVDKSDPEIGTIKTIWRILTPWDEQQEHFADYMKKWPSRFKEGVLSTTRWSEQPTQSELKARYEDFNSQPMWAQLLYGSSGVIKDKDGKYIEVIFSEAKTGKTAVADTARKIAKTAVKERIDWKKITDAIDRGKVKSASDAARWSKVKEALKAGEEKESAARTRKLIGDAVKAVAKQKSKPRIDVYKPQVKEVSPVESRKIGDINKSIRQHFASLKTPVKTTTKAKPVFTLEMLYDIRELTQSETVNKIENVNKQIHQTKSETKTKTLRQLQEKLLTKLQTEVKTAVQTQVMTATELSLAVQTALLTETLTATETKTAIQEALQTALKTKVDSKTKPRLKRVVKVLIDKIPQIKQASTSKKIDSLKPVETFGTVKKLLPFKIPSKEYQKKAREAVKSSKSAIAWRQGELHGKDRWDVVTDPYGQSDYMIIMGRKPVGARIVRGPKSAYKTAQVIGNVPHSLKRETTIDQAGMFHTKIKPLGDRSKDLQITFHHDINITGRKNPRITPPIPRLPK